MAYSPVFKAGYTNWDDQLYTYENHSVQSLSTANLKIIFGSFKMSNYHPLTELSFAVENSVFGERAIVHHTVNLIVHALNAALVFAFLSLFSARKRLAFAAALVWALHPANVESVAWIAERKNLLYSLFYIPALIAYWRSLENANKKFYWAALGLFMLALGAKAAAATLPLALLLLEIYRGRNTLPQILRRTSPFFAAAGIFTAIAVIAQSSSGRILPAMAPWLFSFYILHTLSPLNLCAVYPYREMLGIFGAKPLLYALPALGFVPAFAAVCKKNRRAAWGMAFFALHLLPFITVIPVGGIIAADRYLYLPAIGLIFALTELGGAIADTCPARSRICAAIAACICLASAAATFERAKVWTSSFTLWTDTLEKFPANETANLNMADVYLKRGDPQKAAACYIYLLNLDGENSEALYNLGTLYGMAGRYKEAEDLLKRTIRLKPENCMAWNNLGIAYQKQGRQKEAQKAFKMATAAASSYAPAYSNLAETDAALGDCRSARAHYLQALSLGLVPGAGKHKHFDNCR